MLVLLINRSLITKKRDLIPYFAHLYWLGGGKCNENRLNSDS